MRYPETQLTLFPPTFVRPALPSTRYQGSKAKLMPWIGDHLQRLDFQTALDAFGGSGVVSYWLKRHGKQVTYNDYLRFNHYIGLAIIENSHTLLEEEDVEAILTPKPGRQYRRFIAETFQGIYYTEEENEWLDVVVQNLEDIRDLYKKALGYYALIQACLVKRPFNLFHRSNLYLRLAEVDRSFGNKTTWDRPFEEHFRRFVAEANGLVFDNGQPNRALNRDALDLDGDYDLVYLDPPYTAASGGTVDYLAFYHFLEGMVHYDRWAEWIDFSTKHRRLRSRPNLWNDPDRVRMGFLQMFDRFRHSILVVSYRSDGIPRIEQLVEDMRQFKRRVTVSRLTGYQYVLSPRRVTEVLVVGE
ncbi:MAG: DNA adenine methylase [Anaerolineae bacterium]